jgi:hypothetical protein
MCSIEEAWAGQNFDEKKVISQSDIHNQYIAIPNNILNRNRGNEFMIGDPKKPQSRELTRGINSKYSREPRVSDNLRSTNNMDLTISSSLPNTDKYMGIEPLPSYVDIYNKSDNYYTQQKQNTQNTFPQNTFPQNTQQSFPQPISTGEHFTDIENAFNISDTLDTFMSRTNTTTSNTNSNLLNEDTNENTMIINNKFNNLNLNNIKDNKNNKNKFKNINSKNNVNFYNEFDTDTDTENYINKGNVDANDSINNINNINIQTVLIDILNKLNKIENDLHNNNKKNMYDIILYILIGILLSFIIYSIVFAIKK